MHHIVHEQLRCAYQQHNITHLSLPIDKQFEYNLIHYLVVHIIFGQSNQFIPNKSLLRTYSLTKLLSKIAYSVFGQLFNRPQVEKILCTINILMLLHYIVWRYWILWSIFEMHVKFIERNYFTNELSNLNEIPQCNYSQILVMICVIFEKICQNLN